MIRAFVFDLDGCVWAVKALNPGARDALGDRLGAVAVLTTSPTGSWTTARQSINAVSTALLAKLGVNG